MRRATFEPSEVAKIFSFQSTLSMRRATFFSFTVRIDREFQSTLSMRRATLLGVRVIPYIVISIHALHEESDNGIYGTQAQDVIFQSTLSMRRATIRFQWRITQIVISIHALHEESDSAAGHFCPFFETQASCLALSISNNTADTTNNMSKTSNWLSVSF